MNAEIKKQIIERRITRLCHFTKSSKLLHILSSESGIVANQFLKEEAPELLQQNDYLRLDGLTDHISCSVQYPNSWYLNRIKEKDPLFNQWVVIFIDPYLMLQKGTKFCHRNAAAGRGAFIQEGVTGFMGMFESSVQGIRELRRSPKMLDCCPTDDQAEVMIYKNIPRSAILGVAVPNFEKAHEHRMKLKFIKEAIEVNWIVAPDLFNNNWSVLVRAGKVPVEILIGE